MKIRIFYIWYNGEEGGYGSCEKENFSIHDSTGMIREAVFEYSNREEFIKKCKENIPEERAIFEKLADEHCSNI